MDPARFLNDPGLDKINEEEAIPLRPKTQNQMGHGLNHGEVNFFNSDDDRQSDFKGELPSMINRDDMNDTGLVELVHGIQHSENVGGVFPACSGSS